MSDLGILTIQSITQQVETLSGGQRQGVAVARAAAFGSRVLILDEIADRIHIHRLGRRIAVVTPKTHTMSEVVGIMTGATEPGAPGHDQVERAAVEER